METLVSPCYEQTQDLHSLLHIPIVAAVPILKIEICTSCFVKCQANLPELLVLLNQQYSGACYRITHNLYYCTSLSHKTHCNEFIDNCVHLRLLSPQLSLAIIAEAIKNAFMIMHRCMSINAYLIQVPVLIN